MHAVLYYSSLVIVGKECYWSSSKIAHHARVVPWSSLVDNDCRYYCYYKRSLDGFQFPRLFSGYSYPPKRLQDLTGPFSLWAWVRWRTMPCTVWQRSSKEDVRGQQPLLSSECPQGMLKKSAVFFNLWFLFFLSRNSPCFEGTPVAALLTNGMRWKVPFKCVLMSGAKSQVHTPRFKNLLRWKVFTWVKLDKGQRHSRGVGL